MKKIVFFALISILYIPTYYAQLVKQASMCRYEPNEIVDPEKGITLYDNLNATLGGQNARYDEDNNLVQGWVEDYYENGTVLHRGYYINGQLRSFKNYYDNGNVERKFSASSWKRSKMKTYFYSGQTKSKVAYFKASEQKMQSYYANGNQQTMEQKNKFAQYYIMTKSFYEDGKIKSVFQLVDKKSMTYNKVEYYANGSVKEEGTMVYDVANSIYYKEGAWKRYDDSGKLVAEQQYSGGKVDNTSRSW